MDWLLELNWFAVGQIILIDILLGGDNAIVIALACRNLPARLRVKGIMWGTCGAILLRIALIGSAVTLFKFPYVKLVGGILLLWIGYKLLAASDSEHEQVHGSDRLLTAVKIIILADLVMSIDNVIAVASTAEQAGGEYQMALVVFGILVSIPMIVWGSTMILKLMERFPFIITLGAALLGYLAGGMVFADAAYQDWIAENLPYHQYAVPGIGLQISIPGLIGAIAVVVAGNWLGKEDEEPTDPT
jgi:YjbE family integral membrane protein